MIEAFDSKLLMEIKLKFLTTYNLNNSIFACFENELISYEQHKLVVFKMNVLRELGQI